MGRGLEFRDPGIEFVAGVYRRSRTKAAAHQSDEAALGPI